MQAITGRSDQAHRLHDIADQIWHERNRTPRNTPLWESLNEMATALHDAAAETAKETQEAMALRAILTQERRAL